MDGFIILFMNSIDAKIFQFAVHISRDVSMYESRKMV